jgi:hypothetical protein
MLIIDYINGQHLIVKIVISYKANCKDIRNKDCYNMRREKIENDDVLPTSLVFYVYVYYV